MIDKVGQNLNLSFLAKTLEKFVVFGRCGNYFSVVLFISIYAIRLFFLWFFLLFLKKYENEDFVTF